MKKYILYDFNTGTIQFYIEKVNPEIPISAKPIDDEAYDFLLGNNGLYAVNVEDYERAEKVTKGMLVKIESKPQIDKESVSDLEIAFAEYIIETEIRLSGLEAKISA